MRISWRPSGGRGEYELAGKQGTVAKSDLFGKPLFYELSPEISFPARAEARLTDGKPRIRLLEERKGRHPYNLLASVLLLPQPRRQVTEASSGPGFVRNGGFVVHDIDIDVTRLDQTAAIRPLRMRLRSKDGLDKTIDVVKRLSQVFVLWGAGSAADTDVSGQQLQAHQQAVLAGDLDWILQAAQTLQDAHGPNGDPLAALGLRFGLDLGGSEPDAEVSDNDPEGDDDAIEVGEANVRALRKWRLQAMRGPEARRFANEVKAAYSYKCAVMGHALPRIDGVTKSSAVDAAHIRPWSKSDLNIIQNGIALCKMCHWAFDNGLLHITKAGDQYVAEVPDAIWASVDAAKFDVSWLKPFLGPLPESNFPANKSLRPHASLLDEVNAWLSRSLL